MRGRTLGFSLIGLAVSSLASAQSELAGRQQYPQFRVLSGLPGGGFGVLPNGQLGAGGAAALTTPIGYTMGRGQFAFGVFNTSADQNPFHYDKEGDTVNKGNGSAFGMMGIGYHGYRLTVSGMVLSSHGDSELNLQFSPPSFGRLGVAVGVQDAFNVAGASGEQIDLVESHISRSFFAVGTYDLGKGSYLSLGKGERRFQGLFGNVSAPLCARVRGIVEYDGFNFNGGFLYNTGKIVSLPGDSSGLECNLFLGTVRGKYGTIGLTFTF